MKRALFAFAVLFCSLSLRADPRQSYPFSVVAEREGNGHRIVARNNGPATVSVSVSIADAWSVASDRPFPFVAVVPPGGGTVSLARVRPATARAGYRFRIVTSWVFGDVNARQSPNAMYRLPYRDGLAYHIGQSAGGPLRTHTGPESHYAVDIAMPLGTPVVAARDGVVIYVEDRQIYGGQSPDMVSKANEVRIRHSDGTIAVYAHLAHGGVSVYPGQIVRAGRQIGLAGSTGYSSGPHLHFVVQTAVRTGNRLTMLSLPFRFYVGKPPALFVPRFGMYAVAQYSTPGQVPRVGVPVQLAPEPSPAIRPSLPSGRPQ